MGAALKGLVLSGLVQRALPPRWLGALLFAGLTGLAGLADATALEQPAPVSAPALNEWTARDDRGVQLRLAAPPQRIVSLLPSLTETVCELGACHRLVGVDRYSNWPASVRALPQLGGGLDPSVEAIVALQPDLVLVAQSSRVVQRLEALGLPVAVFEPRTHADVRRVLVQVAQLIGAAQAEAVWRRIDATVQAAAQSLRPAQRGQRVYFEVNAGPYAAGAASFIGETLGRLHAHSIVPASMGPFPRIGLEYVVRADPQRIMIGVRSAIGMEQRPGWQHMEAVRHGRVCRFSASEADLLVRAGPRMGEAAQWMAACLARPL